MNQSKSTAVDCGRLTRFGVVALAMFGLAGSQRAEADLTISTPAGLRPGDTFRIAFLTGRTTFATSDNIATYNSFVNADATSQAGGGLVVYSGTALTFNAIASTATVDAITNIGQFGAALYLADGTKVATADTTKGIWSGQSLLSPINENLTGYKEIYATPVWTGTYIEGQIDNPLGGGFVTYGVSNVTANGWIYAGFGEEFSQARQMYGISQALTVPAPEPSSIVLAMLAGCGVVGAYVRRRIASRRG